MSSVLNTNLFDLYDQWGQRVAFNEGYRQQQVVEAKQAGRDAFHLGIDRTSARSAYFENRDQRFDEARQFIESENVQIESAEVEPVDIEPISEVTDGEETLGMESVVANETEDQGSWQKEAAQDHFDGTIVDEYIDPDGVEWREFGNGESEFLNSSTGHWESERAIDDGNFEYLEANGAFDGR